MIVLNIMLNDHDHVKNHVKSFNMILTSHISEKKPVIKKSRTSKNILSCGNWT